MGQITPGCPNIWQLTLSTVHQHFIQEQFCIIWCYLFIKKEEMNFQEEYCMWSVYCMFIYIYIYLDDDDEEKWEQKTCFSFSWSLTDIAPYKYTICVVAVWKFFRGWQFLPFYKVLQFVISGETQNWKKLIKKKKKFRLYLYLYLYLCCFF